MKRTVSIDGKIVAGGDALVSVFDRGFTLADGLFETIRVYPSGPLRLDLHLARLRQSADKLGIAVPNDIAPAIDELLQHDRNASSSRSLRITLTRGAPEGAGLVAAEATPTLVLTLSDLTFPDDIYTTGISAIISSGRRNEFSITAGIKTLSYTDSVLAAMEARKLGADDALLLDTRGHVSEAASSNVVLVRGDELITPPASCGAVPGITLAIVRDLSASLGLSVNTRELDTHDVEAADELFLCSSLRELAPVIRVGEKRIGSGLPGPRFTRILRAYREYAAS